MKEAKYLTLDELLKVIKSQFPTFFGLNLDTLKKIGISKREDGFYYKADFVKYYLEHSDKEYNDFYKIKSFPVSEVSHQDKILHPELPILTLDPIKFLERTAYIEAYNFSLLFYSKKIQDYVKKTREILGIPPEGLKDNLAMIKWLKQIAKDFYELGYLKNINDTGDTYKICLIYVDKFLRNNTSFKRKNFERQMLFRRIFIDYLTLNDPFYSLNKTHSKENKSLRGQSLAFKFPMSPKKFLDDNIEIHLVVYKDTTKDELNQIINSSWKKIEDYKKRLPTNPKIERIKDIGYLYKKLKAFELHKKGCRYEKIADLLKSSNTNIRKIISDMKKEIIQAEKEEMLP